ncbi:hypothetical protein [Nocardia terpenica]|uniref:Uncharacterized protein n=1 Tax=Nocardia terpenica TaxID=455432 RepID=A0A6G9ZDV2_9NOCA|nr:hypothetical protein [Nocardia terpenica]QIS23620.1 hypothetical protein F6W96_40490 [Nocardia terpenica]
MTEPIGPVDAPADPIPPTFTDVAAAVDKFSHALNAIITIYDRENLWLDAAGAGQADLGACADRIAAYAAYLRHLDAVLLDTLGPQACPPADALACQPATVIRRGVHGQAAAVEDLRHHLAFCTPARVADIAIAATRLRYTFTTHPSRWSIDLTTALLPLVTRDFYGVARHAARVVWGIGTQYGLPDLTAGGVRHDERFAAACDAYRVRHHPGARGDSSGPAAPASATSDGVAPQPGSNSVGNEIC